MLPKDLLQNFIDTVTPESIEKSELAGQKNFISRTFRDALPIGKAADWELLESWGIEKGEQLDALFCYAKLPTGWSKVGAEEPRISTIRDKRGLVRATVFYKAASYDRKANLHVLRNRFRAGRDNNSEEAFAYVVRDDALNRIVQRFETGSYAYLKSEPSCIGFIFYGVFHYKADRNGFNALAPSEDAAPITVEQFYEDYHNINISNSGTLHAAETLARKEADDFASALPTDDRQWLSEYDFVEC